MLESDIQISESLIFDNDTYRLEFIIDNIIWKNFIHDNNILLQQIAFEAFKEGNLVFDKQRINQMNIIFCNNDIIQTLNADYRQIDKPTNVLSFPTYSKEELDNKEYCFGDIQMFGDIFIAYEYCFVEAQENKKSFTYHYSWYSA